MILRNTLPLVVIALFLQMSIGISQEKKRSLLVPAYPGSVPDEYVVETPPIPRVPTESREQTFYSKDALDKVKAHFAKSVSPFEPTPDDVTGIYGAVVSHKEVVANLAGRGVERTEAGWSVDIGSGRAGVTLYGTRAEYEVTVVNVLDQLKNAYLMRFIGAEGEDGTTVAKHLEDPELTKVLAKYEHVKWEYFPLVKGKRMDEVISDKHYADRAKALAKEQEGLVKRMTELSTAGKYDEATKVGDRMTEISMMASDPKYNWDTAISCLDEMERNSYATKIVIDRPLAEWEVPAAGK